MILLGIEASSNIFSVSIVEGGNELAYKISSEAFSASENCALFVQAVLEESKIRNDEIDRIAINIGPGSFTGLRVAHSFALGFSQVANIPVVGVSAFELLFYKREPSVFAIIESRRDEVYFAYPNDEIQLVKKNKLKNFISDDSVIITNTDFGLDELASIQIIISRPNAKELCLIAEKKERIVDLPEILYFHNFSKK